MTPSFLAISSVNLLVADPEWAGLGACRSCPCKHRRQSSVEAPDTQRTRLRHRGPLPEIEPDAVVRVRPQGRPRCSPSHLSCGITSKLAVPASALDLRPPQVDDPLDDAVRQ